MEASQRPLELILARNLLASLSTPAFLVDGDAAIVFFNEAAGMLLGRRFEDSGPIPAKEWTEAFGPYDEQGQRLPYDSLHLTQALRGNEPAHDRIHIRTHGGRLREIEVSGLPIVGTGGYRGAIVVFWPVDSKGGTP